MEAFDIDAHIALPVVWMGEQGGGGGEQRGGGEEETQTATSTAFLSLGAVLREVLPGILGEVLPNIFRENKKVTRVCGWLVRLC